jgi:hypothetical protein
MAAARFNAGALALRDTKNKTIKTISALLPEKIARELTGRHLMGFVFHAQLHDCQCLIIEFYKATIDGIVQPRNKRGLLRAKI